MSTDKNTSRVPTIFDVARLAGVSHQTVSRVINDLPNVRESTRERVERAIRQLNYVPSMSARALVTRRSRVLGLVMTSGAGYGFSSIAASLNAAAGRARYSVISIGMLEPKVSSVREAIESLVRRSVEGIVLLTGTHSVLLASQHLESVVPLVTMDPSQDVEGTSVATDQYLGARMATEHLLALGHRDIAHLAGPVDSPDANEQIRGWQAALADAGLPATGLVHGDWSPDSGYAFGAQLSVGAPFTAVFAASDQMALGLMHALDARGFAVPGDVSVVGFDDTPDAAHYRPPLTTVRQDFDALGEQLLAALLGALESRDNPTRTLVVPTLQVRESSAPPRQPNA